MGQTIPFACQDWASTKAAYRFLSNDRVSEHDILSGHFQASAERVKATDGPVLVLQDATTFSYQRERPETHRLHGQDDPEHGKKRRGSATATHAMRHPDAFESCCQCRWIATWPGGGEVLDEKAVQGGFGAQAPYQSHVSTD
ncbi:transposase DNA-binding-containing protein [Paraburkholderia unamae]|uniref:transposase DNA-binding-containing protein n=1 Tax=Paraburkholderia unamae TaxID=219649 RepID=UPI003FD8079B